MQKYQFYYTIFLHGIYYLFVNKHLHIQTEKSRQGIFLLTFRTLGKFFHTFNNKLLLVGRQLSEKPQQGTLVGCSDRRRVLVVIKHIVYGNIVMLGKPYKIFCGGIIISVAVALYRLVRHVYYIRYFIQLDARIFQAAYPIAENIHHRSFCSLIPCRVYGLIPFIYILVYFM